MQHPRRLFDALRAFIQVEASSGIVLLAAAVVALAWANSGAADSYSEFWQTMLGPETLQFWVNDGLMTLFFLVAGLEIKRELVQGELSSPRRAALPAIAALGGMVTPAAIYLAFNAGGTGAHGWGVPMATDIAFALGVLSLLGERVPLSLKVFLLALAIADDIGAIAVIAVFYSQGIDFVALGAAVTVIGLIIWAQGAGLRGAAFYIIPALGLWYATYLSGIHATLAGVALGLLTPARPAAGEDEAPDERLERLLHPYVSFAIVPLFALANTGVPLSGNGIAAALSSPVTLGVFLGLLAGKPAGILAFSFLASRLRLAELPSGGTWWQMAALGVLAGIGFTVSLLVASLAFDDAALVDQAKIGVIMASVVAGVAGYVALRLTLRNVKARP
jgi:NhaA family Na+:H+ antiporter